MPGLGILVRIRELMDPSLWNQAFALAYCFTSSVIG